jgi:hypothetical protein
MRPLYPSAHHDRFTHSLGVYHLARTAFDSIVENTSQKDLGGVDLPGLCDSFLISALMHDCGHSPFSHTFEKYYNNVKQAENFLFELVDDQFVEDFKQLYDDDIGGPAPHELFSAAILLKHYTGTISKEFPKANPQLIARMITGCTHLPADTTQKEVENCLIRLINGSAIDVDKLDYILRDTWASGVNNVSIDTQRLLTSLILVNFGEGGATKLEPAFNKSALSVIQSVVDGRNFLYHWVYSHHTVQYYNELLKSVLKKLNTILSPTGNSDLFLSRLFSKEAFAGPVRLDHVSLYLPSDGDIFYLLKKHKDEIPEMSELLSRQATLTPLWKTRAEFELIFKDKKPPTKRSTIRKLAKKILKDVIGDPDLLESVMVVKVKPKIVEIEEQTLFVAFQGVAYPYTEVDIAGMAARRSNDDISYFYIYIPRVVSKKKEACIEALKNYKV